ncbi:hypothetical protein AOL_s00054g318 [Orbilia oligospora ATCC 24927]|uniref:40S ribosomal protein S12 n=1 Tax=Arthrobotrys oligospora (strain ATCC 24927 / CBS 115.81 / DSM 1491) TaxID=756982 RepID=G1X624_ARTOA|nr:hypothetical protein AOL_s00054g318 [Orbilia oligospora ATCC 24927]EGX51619.1 hypothetical protein AOL_s00054g318 [Orbilia oligospora ATCC 24927]
MEFMNTLNLAELLADINLTSVVQFFYFNAILITITLNVFPPFARKLYTYGKNASDTKPTKAATKDVDKKPRTTTEPKSPLDVLLDLVGKLQVPHSWFMHFYAFSFAVQLFWLLQVIFHGRILQLVLDNLPGNQPPKDAVVEPQIVPGPDGSQSLETILLCIICMTMQSARRLWESIYIQKSGNSKMGILIYIAGITHYTMMGFATWCEGIETLRLNTNIPISHPSDLLKPPRINTLLAIPFFFLGSGLQHDAHVHLASLSDGEEVPAVEVADEIEVAADTSAGKGQMSVEDALKGVLRHALIHDGLARGLREASKALDRRQAHMCVLNENCDEDAYKKLVEALCAEHKIPLIKVGDGKKLGEWAGLCTLDREGNPRKVVNCSCVVVRDWGEESTERSILLDYFQTR